MGYLIYLGFPTCMKTGPQRTDWLIHTGHFILLTNNRTNWKAQSTSSTVLSHMRKVGIGIKGNGLITTVITGHVALAAVNAQVFINQCHNLLPVIQVTISSNTIQSYTNDILLTWFRRSELRSFDSRTRTTTSARFDFKFFRVFSNYRLPGKLHFIIFHYEI